MSVLFVLDQANKIDDQAPPGMDCTGLSCNGGVVWENTHPSGIVRWNGFVDTFNRRNPIGFSNE